MGTTIHPTIEISKETGGQKLLLNAGIIASLYYVVINIFVGLQYDGYSFASQTVSELSAIDAPTRMLWMILVAVYTLFMIAFGWGVMQAAQNKKPLRRAGVLIILSSIIGLAWPPMHQREVLAVGGGSLTDTLHIVFTFITVVLMMMIIIFSLTALGKGFRIYSIVSIVILIGMGILTSLQAPEMESGLATPTIGIWERINIGAFMLWVIVFAKSLKVESQYP